MQNWIIGLLAFLLLQPGANVFAQSTADIVAADKGFTREQGRPPSWYLDQHKWLSEAINGLKPQTPGTIDAYILVVGLDADPVFQRESAEAAKVLSRRYNAQGRTILLASGSAEKIPQGSPANINLVMAAMAAKMDLDEDVLILYTTSHGAPKIGIVYKDGNESLGMIAPRRLGKMLSDAGIKRRLVMISACYSGTFIPHVASNETIIITAASAVQPSFGCSPGNDWTFFGDALINNGLRTTKALRTIATEMTGLIGKWEQEFNLEPSDPQVSIGADSGNWLESLESRIPQTATPKTGTPAIDSGAFAEIKAKAKAAKPARK